jgi:tetratricopeptide (TPR) repeat protein
MRALALAVGGMARLVGGDQEMAQALFRQSLPLFREARDRVRTALLAAVLGYLLSVRRQEAEAVKLLNESQALLRELHSDQLADYGGVQQELNVVFLYDFLGQIRLCQGDSAAAEQLFAQGLATVRRAQDRFTILITLYNMAVSCHAQGNSEGAAAHLAEGLSLAAEAGDDTSAAYYLEGLAVLGTPADDPQRAVRLLGAAGALLEAKGSGWLHAFLPPRANRDDDLAALRSRLDKADFDEALAFGRSIGGKRAIEYALGRYQSSEHSQLASPTG